MPIGILVNVASVVLGGLLGSVFGDRLGEEFKHIQFINQQFY